MPGAWRFRSVSPRSCACVRLACVCVCACIHVRVLVCCVPGRARVNSSASSLNVRQPAPCRARDAGRRGSGASRRQGAEFRRWARAPGVGARRPWSDVGFRSGRAVAVAELGSRRGTADAGGGSLTGHVSFCRDRDGHTVPGPTAGRGGRRPAGPSPAAAERAHVRLRSITEPACTGSGHPVPVPLRGPAPSRPLAQGAGRGAGTRASHGEEPRGVLQTGAWALLPGGGQIAL